MLTARRHRLTLIVHAIDDTGALCGSRPRGGRWLPNETLPVNCPTCLLKMSLPRFAYCQVPTAASSTSRKLHHIRRVGPEGVQKSTGAGRLETLCGLVAGWDVELVGRTPAPREQGFCGSCVRQLRAARTGLAVRE